MELLKVVGKLEELRERDVLSSSDKLDIELMYRDVFGRNFVKTSCNDTIAKSKNSRPKNKMCH